MGKNSSIEWTDHTFNPWWGCLKVSPGCEHCYAETLSSRWGHHIWGPAKTTPRRKMSVNYWKQPFKWNTEAKHSGVRKRVFCASMADVFEDHADVYNERTRLWRLIEATPGLDWLLLTKRPENILSMIPRAWRESAPSNVWYGTSCETQEYAETRIPYLLEVPAVVRWLSCEPLLGPIDLERWLEVCAFGGSFDHYSIDWVIVGGESGHGARPMQPDWARSLCVQCKAYDIAFHFKQWGQYRYGDRRVERQADGSLLLHEDGIPIHLNVGKKAAGRLLDGRTWDEYPTPRVVY